MDNTPSNKPVQCSEMSGLLFVQTINITRYYSRWVELKQNLLRQCSTDLDSTKNRSCLRKFYLSLFAGFSAVKYTAT